MFEQKSPNYLERNLLNISFTGFNEALGNSSVRKPRQKSAKKYYKENPRKNTRKKNFTDFLSKEFSWIFPQRVLVDFLSNFFYEFPFGYSSANFLPIIHSRIFFRLCFADFFSTMLFGFYFEYSFADFILNIFRGYYSDYSFADFLSNTLLLIYFQK